jgi:hypothetical protein
MLPNFVVIGAPRSGTSWIHHNLKQHPQIFTPKIKELHFFDRDYERGIAYYESYFADWRNQPAIGESTPDYLHGAYTSQDIPALMHRHLPDAKLIACLRNPTERAYSRYWNSKAKYEKNAELTFEQKLLDRPEFIVEGFYFDQLMRFYNVFPREQILVTLYDDLRDHPVEFMQTIYGFLGVDATFDARLNDIRINASAGKKLLAKSRIAWNTSKFLAKCGMRSAAEWLRKENSIAIPPMTPQTREYLVGVYREPNRKLQQLIGRDLGHWDHPAAGPEKLRAKHESS